MKRSIETIFVRDALVALLGVLLTFCCLIQRVFSFDAYFNLRWLVAVFIFFVALTSILIYKKDNGCYDWTPFASLIIFLLSSFISSYLNRAGYMLHVGIFSILMIFDIYLVCLLSLKVGNFKLLCKSILLCLVAVCMLNDILSLASDNFYGNGKFLLYSKFYACYLHIIMVALYGYLYENADKPRARFCVLIGACIMVALYLDCTTAVIGLLIIALLSMCPNTVTKKLMNPKFAIITMLVSSSIFVIIDNIYENPLFKWVMTGVFGESADMNSRRYIYESMGTIFQVKPFFGFGAENNFNACRLYIRLNQYEAAPDVQNGLLDWIVSYGIIGAFLSLVFVYTCFRSVYKNRLNGSLSSFRSIRWFMFLLYAFFVMGSVEIAFDILFYFSVTLFLFSGLCGNTSELSESTREHSKRGRSIRV